MTPSQPWSPERVRFHEFLLKTVLPATAVLLASCRRPCLTDSGLLRPGSARTLRSIRLHAGNTARVGVVAYPDAEVFDWASAVLDTEVTVLRGLRYGGSPWLLRAEGREVVLRVARGEQAAETATEVAAMIYAARVAGAIFPVAELLGYDLAERTGYGLVLTACMPGTSAIPPEPDPGRLQALGAAAARISSIEVTPAPALPVRRRPIEAEDFAGMRREQGAPDLLRAAEAAVAATRPEDDQLGLVHGDLWYGNTLWDDGRLTAVLDWDCAASAGRHRPRLAALRRGLVPRRRSRRAHPARMGGPGGQTRERRPLLGRRRGARLPAGHGLVPGIDGRSGSPRPDPRGHARAPRRLPRRRAQSASSGQLGVRVRSQWICQCARAWLSSSDRPRSRPSMIDQNREHFMGSLAGHCRPCLSAVRATSIRCCCSASSASL